MSNAGRNRRGKPFESAISVLSEKSPDTGVDERNARRGDAAQERETGFSTKIPTDAPVVMRQRGAVIADNPI
jgi:hypothetical protein